MGAVHARVLSGTDGMDVVAVVDVNTSSAKEIGASIGANVAGSIEESLAFGAEAVLIATPTPTHPSLVEEALDAGLHVLCEKPLSLNDDDRRLSDAASTAGLVLQVGLWRRFSPPWVAAKRAIDSGVVGTPVMVRLSQWDADPPPPEFCDPEVSGGLAIDCGVHEYDLAEWLTGLKVESVAARNLPIVSREVDAAGDVDNLVAVLDLEGGVSATVDLSRNGRYGDDVRTEVLCSDGAVFVESLPRGVARLAGPDGVTEIEGSHADDVVASGVAAQAKAFAAVVRGDEMAIPGASESERSVQIGRAIQRAARSGAREPI